MTGFYGGVASNNKIFFSASEYNAFCVVDKENGEIEFIDHFIDEPIYKRDIHKNAFKIGKNIIFTPFGSNSIHIINIESKEQECIKINKANGFVKAVCVDNSRIILIPQSLTNPIIEFDIENRSYQYNYNIYELIKEIYADYESISVCDFGAEVYENNIYIVLREKNKIMMFDIDKGNVDAFQIGEYKLRNIAINGHKIFCTVFYENKLIEYDLEKKVLKEYYLKNNRDIGEFVSILIYNNKYVLVLGYNRDVILYLDNGYLQLISDTITSEFKTNNKKRPFYMGNFIDEKGVLNICPGCMSGMIYINGDSLNINYVKFKFDNLNKIVDKIIMAKIENELENNRVLFECKEECDIEDFLGAINKYSCEMEAGNSGREIWRQVR